MAVERSVNMKEHDATDCCEKQPLARIVPGRYWRFSGHLPFVLGGILILLIGCMWLALGMLLLIGAILVLILLSIALLLLFGIWLPGVVFWGYFGRPFDYQPLGQESDSFRLLQISPGIPGVEGEDIRCQLVHSRFREAHYMALSYSWGTSTSMGSPFSRRIEINDKARRLSQPVHDAICSLVDPQSTRYIWIDSVCIAQSDPEEKAVQVELMLEIYRYAAEVTVWLDMDVGLSPTRSVLHATAKMIDDLDDVVAALFKNINLLVDDEPETALSMLHSMSEKELKTLKDILRVRWWERVWVIQEVAVNSRVVFRYRAWSVPWACLSRLIRVASAPNSGTAIPPQAMRLIKNVEYVRQSSREPALNLLALVHRFENHKASLPRDKVFALMGLAQPAENTPNFSIDHEDPFKFCIDYEIEDRQVFARFTRSCLDKLQTLAPLIALEEDIIFDPSTVLGVISRIHEELAVITSSLSALLTEGASGNLRDLDTYQPDYPIDWSFGLRHSSCKRRDRISWVPLRNTRTRWRKAALWDAGLGDISSSLRIKGAQFQASGNCPAKIDTKLRDLEVIGVQGWELDTVQTVGDIFSTTQSITAQARQINKWERLAGGPWTDESHDLCIAFLCTITAGHDITALSSSWQMWFTNHTGNNDVLTRLRAVCAGRRFFLTSTGMMGLGHTGVAEGDRVCVLPGADVPYILRRSSHESSWTGFHSGSCRFAPVCKRSRHLKCCLPPLHRLIGQAYVHGKMHYSGDAVKDVQEGRLKIETFGIE